MEQLQAEQLQVMPGIFKLGQRAPRGCCGQPRMILKSVLVRVEAREWGSAAEADASRCSLSTSYVFEKIASVIRDIKYSRRACILRSRHSRAEYGSMGGGNGRSAGAATLARGCSCGCVSANSMVQ